MPLIVKGESNAYETALVKGLHLNVTGHYLQPFSAAKIKVGSGGRQEKLVTFLKFI